MSNGKVRPLNESGVTPEVLANSIQEDVADFATMYCIVFTKDGNALQYISGSAAGMTLAAAILTQTAIETINGD